MERAIELDPLSPHLHALFAWLLDPALGERDPHILHLPSKPIYDPMRSDPRFVALLRKMRLEAC